MAAGLLRYGTGTLKAVLGDKILWQIKKVFAKHTIMQDAGIRTAFIAKTVARFLPKTAPLIGRVSY